MSSEQNVCTGKTFEEGARRMATLEGDTVIEMHNVDKWFGHFHALKDINLSVNVGSVSI